MGMKRIKKKQLRKLVPSSPEEFQTMRYHLCMCVENEDEETTSKQRREEIGIVITKNM